MDFNGSNQLFLGVIIIAAFGMEIYVLSKMYGVSIYEKTYLKK